jgi:hypothetical protein
VDAVTRRARFGISNVLASLADEASSAIELQLGHQVNAVRDLAASWTSTVRRMTRPGRSSRAAR